MRRWIAAALLLLTALAATPAAAGDWRRPAPGYGYGHGHGWRPAPVWQHPYRFAPPRHDRRDWRHRGHGWQDDRRHGGWRRQDERRLARPW